MKGGYGVDAALSQSAKIPECPGESQVSAITREKQIKAGSRRQKGALIQAMNPEWQDLSFEL